ncbi:MAG: hypothetical protein QN152_03535 [Armatimonadota bacterium]|nr:hypothetical protein [Armatimonadota bacterium]
MRVRPVVLILAAVLVVTACGAAGVAQLATIVSRFADPAGDTAAGAPPTVYDALTMVTRRIDNSPFGSYDTLQVEVTFAQPVVLPPPGGTGDAAGTQMVPELAIDTDENPATGLSYGCGALGFSMPGGDFFLVSWEGPGRLANGNYTIVDTTLSPVGEASVAVSGNTLTFNIPLSALGGDDGATRTGIFAGNMNGGSIKVTDCAPNGGGMVITKQGGPGLGVRR